jgi:tripartite-type tricarboxylate transporter receptor subunit TctC
MAHTFNFIAFKNPMIHTINRRTALAASLLSLTQVPAWASPGGGDASVAWPDRPIKLIVPFPPGGIDAAARIVSEGLGKRLGQTIVVENKPGAAGTLGTRGVAQSKADAYTMLAGTMSTLVTGPIMSSAVGYNPVQDFEPVGLFARLSYVLAVPVTSPFQSVEQLVAHLRKNPDSLAYSTAGPGTPQDLSATLFQQLTGTSMRAIPYKGGASAIPDLVSGVVDLSFDLESSVVPLVQGGRLRALGVTSPEALLSLPGVKPVREAPVAGLSGFQVTSWGGLFFPAGVPKPAVEKLSKALSEVLAEEGVQQRLRGAGFAPMFTTPAQAAERVRSEIQHWTAVFAKAGCMKEGRFSC